MLSNLKQIIITTQCYASAVLYMYIMSSRVCPCLSITIWHCIKMAKWRITQQCHMIAHELKFSDAKILAKLQQDHP